MAIVKDLLVMRPTEHPGPRVLTSVTDLKPDASDDNTTTPQECELSSIKWLFCIYDLTQIYVGLNSLSNVLKFTKKFTSSQVQVQEELCVKFADVM